jgi:hypothetical protein
MLIAIKLDRQSYARAIEIENIWTYRVLSAERRAKLRTTESVPESLLDGGHSSPQRSCAAGHRRRSAEA